MELLKGLLSLIFPRRCPFCGGVVAPGERACARCAEKIPGVSVLGEICPRCGRETKYCGCKGRNFSFDGCVCPFYYEDLVRRALINFKFRARPSSASAFASFCADAVRLRYKEKRFDLVTSVPLTARERRKRGFNQSQLFAKALAKKLSLPYRETLIKPKDVAPQRTLPAARRWENVAGAFVAKRRLCGERVLLADDIITTGATLDSCAKALKDAGAGEVFCAVIACTRPG